MLLLTTERSHLQHMLQQIPNAFQRAEQPPKSALSVVGS